MTPLNNTWHHTYHANLLAVMLAEHGEIVNHTFDLKAGLDNEVQSKNRGFRTEFADVMCDWILAGEKQMSPAMLELNPNAAKYETEYSINDNVTINTAYGTRLVGQLDYVVDELRRSPDSRRACAMLLSSLDQHIANAMFAGETKCEYICTMGFTFRIVGDELDMVATMRSNNYTTTVCQDVYIFRKIQAVVAERLDKKVGKYYHSAVSAHVFNHERQRAFDILTEYFEDENGEFFPEELWSCWLECKDQHAEWLAEQ